MVDLLKVMEREGLHSEHAAQCVLETRRRSKIKSKLTAKSEERDKNPWGLSRREVRFMDAMLVHYCIKRASTALNVSEHTARDYAKNVSRKMDARQTIIEKYLKWERFRNAEEINVTVSDD